MILGVDISGWQRLSGLDWIAASRAGCRFAIVKVSQGFRVSKRGLKHVARLLEANARLRELGEPEIAIGGYHFADPLKRGLRTFDPEGQAHVFLDGLERSGFPYECPTLIPWLDMEWKSFGKTKEGKARGARFRRQFHSGEVLEWTKRFAGTLGNEISLLGGTYTGRSYVKYRFKGAAELRHYDLWLAAYIPVGPERDHVPGLSELPKPVQLREGHRWHPTIWQWTGRGSVPWYRGGRGRIDRNMVLGGETAFRRLLVSSGGA
jgi:GH25 family lysozyme M1 (1,4-beta-N-acetylmuramidase)